MMLLNHINHKRQMTTLTYKSTNVFNLFLLNPQQKINALNDIINFASTKMSKTNWKNNIEVKSQLSFIFISFFVYWLFRSFLSFVQNRHQSVYYICIEKRILLYIYMHLATLISLVNSLSLSSYFLEFSSFVSLSLISVHNLCL